MESAKLGKLYWAVAGKRRVVGGQAQSTDPARRDSIKPGYQTVDRHKDGGRMRESAGIETSKAGDQDNRLCQVREGSKRNTLGNDKKHPMGGGEWER